MNMEHDTRVILRDFSQVILSSSKTTHAPLISPQLKRLAQT